MEQVAISTGVDPAMPRTLIFGMRIFWICGLPAAVQRAFLPKEVHGIEVAWSWILAHLPPPDGMDLHIACLWPGGNQRKSFGFEGATFHLLPCPQRGRALLLFQTDRAYFRSLHAELRPEVVHGWGTEDSFGLVARQLAPERHVIGIQGLITAYRARVAMGMRTILTAVTERWTLCKARWVVAESRYSLEAAKPLCPRAKMHEIEHPLREDFLRNEPGNGQSQQVLFLGQISERKGISDALRAFAAVEDSAWTLRVIGLGAPKAEADMNQLVDQLGIRGRFRHDRALASFQIVEAMQHSAILLLPTRIDTGPTALKEALTLGLWPVCYDNTGPGEYVRQFGYGSLARDLDLQDLTAKLQEAVSVRPWLDPERRSSLRFAALSRFSREQVWNSLAALYREVSS
jgi:glycosyltransferase involved in cell wall biosynthesis